MAIEGDYRAVERHAGKQPARARVGVDLRIDAGGSFALAAHGPAATDASAPSVNLPRAKFRRCAPSRRREPHRSRWRHLPADAATGKRHEDRVAEPPGGIAHGQNPVAMAPPNTKAALMTSGITRRHRPLHEPVRYVLVRRRAQLIEYFGGCDQPRSSRPDSAACVKSAWQQRKHAMAPSWVPRKSIGS